MPETLPSIVESQEMGLVIQEAVTEEPGGEQSALAFSAQIHTLNDPRLKRQAAEGIRRAVRGHLESRENASRLFLLGKQLLKPLQHTRALISHAISGLSGALGAQTALTDLQIIDLRRFRGQLVSQSLLHEVGETLLPEGRTPTWIGGSNLLLAEEALETPTGQLEQLFVNISALQQDIRQELHQVLAQLDRFAEHCRHLVQPTLSALRALKPLQYVANARRQYQVVQRRDTTTKTAPKSPSQDRSRTDTRAKTQTWPYVEVQVRDLRSAAGYYDPLWKERIRQARGQRQAPSHQRSPIGS